MANKTSIPSVDTAVSQAVNRELHELTHRGGLRDAHVEHKAPLLDSLLKLACPGSNTGYDRVLELLALLEGTAAVSIRQDALEWKGPPGRDWAIAIAVALNASAIDEDSDTLDARRKQFLPAQSLQRLYRIGTVGASTIRTKLWPDALALLSALVVHLARQSGDPSARYFTESQISQLDWNTLTDEEQEEYYNRFLNQAPHLAIPEYQLAPKERIADRNASHPIDLAPLHDILTAFGLASSSTSCAITHEFYGHLVDARSVDAATIETAIQRGLSPLQERSIVNMYSYLACNETHLQATPREVNELDVIIVPGAQRAMIYRVDAIADMVRRLDEPVIIFTGLGPAGSTETTAPIAEADAMFYHFHNVRLVDIEAVTLVLERRASNTFESLIHSLRTIQEVSSRKHRPLNIGLVTNPYHMRRLYLTAVRAMELFPHLVNKLSCITASSSIDLRALTSTTDREQDRRAYASMVYLTEYIKLIGGRGILEF